MPCFHPFQAWQRTDGKVVFAERGDIQRSLTLACGQCIGCRLKRSRQWAIRCMHEASLFERNCFLTLTYKHAPVSLQYRDFQLFMKRLRRAASRYAEPLRFYMCGEYGEKFDRAHFHACIFGFDFHDKVYLSRSPAGFKLYRSPILEELWPHGFSSIGAVSLESAGYIARYIVAKETGFRSFLRYEYVDADGVVCSKMPEFNRMSLGARKGKGGIGSTWIEKYKSDVYPHGKVVVDGFETPAPRYYDKKYGDEELDFAKYMSGVERFADNSDARLAVKEQIQAARLRMLTRKI